MTKKQTIRFLEDPNYRRIHASGFIGSINSVGELQFDIYEEFFATPEKIDIEIDTETLSIISEKKHPQEPEIHRVKHLGVSVPIAVIPGFIEWLQNKLEEYNKLQNTNNK